MKKIIGSLVLFIFGWKDYYPDKFKAQKTVMIAGPHTSNWDLIFALAVYWKKEKKAQFLIKNNYTKGLHGYIFKWMGAIGVDRSKHNNLVDYAVSLFKTNDELILMVPAEGTRKRVEKWKTGFYHIAKNANIPVSFGFLDYKKKIAGVGDLYKLSHDFEKDMLYIQNFYKDISAKFPEQYNPKIF